MAEEARKAPEAATPSSDGKAFGAIAYIFGILIALLIYLLKKDDKFTRFHALQAIFVDLVIMLVSIPLGILLFAGFFVFGFASGGAGFFAGFWIIWLAFMAFAGLLFILRLFFAYKAFSGSRFRLPIIGAQAEKMSEAG